MPTPNNYTPADLSSDFGKEVDLTIQVRERSKADLTRAQLALIDMGVVSIKNGQVFALPGLDVEKFFEQNEQQFTWEAVYKDGSVLRQYERGKQHHFGHIDQSRLEIFRWVSCFDTATDNTEKRVIVELHFGSGIFSFLNGFVPQEVRGEAARGFAQPAVPKLIMKMVKRRSTSTRMPDGEVDEVSIYNRYLIGYETETEKRILCIEPNGFVHFWHGE